MAVKPPITLAEQVAARPVDWAAALLTGINLTISGLIVFGWVHWDQQQTAWVYAVGNFGGTVSGWLLLRRTTTPLANPKSAEGKPLVEAQEPLTRGLPKGG